MATFGDELSRLHQIILAETDHYSEGVKIFSSSNMISWLLDFDLLWKGVVLFSATNHLHDIFVLKKSSSPKKELWGKLFWIIHHYDNSRILRTSLQQSLTAFKILIFKLGVGIFMEEGSFSILLDPQGKTTILYLCVIIYICTHVHFKCLNSRKIGIIIQSHLGQGLLHHYWLGILEYGQMLKDKDFILVCGLLSLLT